MWHRHRHFACTFTCRSAMRVCVLCLELLLFICGWFKYRRTFQAFFFRCCWIFELGTKSTTEPKLFIFMFSLHRKCVAFANIDSKMEFLLFRFNYCVNLLLCQSSQKRKYSASGNIYLEIFSTLFQKKKKTIAVFKGEMYTHRTNHDRAAINKNGM